VVKNYNYNEEPGNIDEAAYKSKIGVQRLWQREKVDWLVANVPQGCKRLLDIGCGSGVVSRKCANVVKEVYGCDISQNAIDYATKKATAEGIKNVKFRKCAAERLPFKDNYFDVVIASELIEHLKDPGVFLMEIKRVLKKRGYVIITTPNYSSLWPIVEVLWSKSGGRNLINQHVSKFNTRSITKILGENKFVIEKIDTMYLFMPFFVMISEKLYNFGKRIDSVILNRLPLGMSILLRARLFDS
jgi:ubiquinone biosynthesis O-methyltransferase